MRMTTLRGLVPEGQSMTKGCVEQDSNRGRSTSSSHKRDYDENYRDYQQHMSDPGCFSSNATGAKCFGYQGDD